MTESSRVDRLYMQMRDAAANDPDPSNGLQVFYSACWTTAQRLDGLDHLAAVTPRVNRAINERLKAAGLTPDRVPIRSSGTLPLRLRPMVINDQDPVYSGLLSNEQTSREHLTALIAQCDDAELGLKSEATRLFLALHVRSYASQYLRQQRDRVNALTSSSPDQWASLFSNDLVAHMAAYYLVHRTMRSDLAQVISTGVPGEALTMEEAQELLAPVAFLDADRVAAAGYSVATTRGCLLKSLAGGDWAMTRLMLERYVMEHPDWFTGDAAGSKARAKSKTLPGQRLNERLLQEIPDSWHSQGAEELIHATRKILATTNVFLVSDSDSPRIAVVADRPVHSKTRLRQWTMAVKWLNLSRENTGSVKTGMHRREAMGPLRFLEHLRAGRFLAASTVPLRIRTSNVLDDALVGALGEVAIQAGKDYAPAFFGNQSSHRAINGGGNLGIA